MNNLRSLFALVIAIATTLSPAVMAHSGLSPLTIKEKCDFGPAKDAGKYDWEHVAYKNVTPPAAICKDKRELQLSFFRVNQKVVSYQDALDEITSHKCVPATWQQLFALGAQHHKFYKDKQVVAIGSVWKHSPKHPNLRGMSQRLVSSLYTDQDGRNLGMHNALGFGQDTVFAAVCKQPKKKGKKKGPKDVV